LNARSPRLRYGVGGCDDRGRHRTTNTSNTGCSCRVASVASPIAQIHHAIGWTMRGSRCAAIDLTLFSPVRSRLDYAFGRG